MLKQTPVWLFQAVLLLHTLAKLLLLSLVYSTLQTNTKVLPPSFLWPDGSYFPNVKVCSNPDSVSCTSEPLIFYVSTLVGVFKALEWIERSMRMYAWILCQCLAVPKVLRPWQALTRAISGCVPGPALQVLTRAGCATFPHFTLCDCFSATDYRLVVGFSLSMGCCYSYSAGTTDHSSFFNRGLWWCWWRVPRWWGGPPGGLCPCCQWTGEQGAA